MSTRLEMFNQGVDKLIESSVALKSLDEAERISAHAEATVDCRFSYREVVAMLAIACDRLAANT
jgi:hypothetical protein